MEQPLIVQAEYSFKGGNNDELCFKKGDLITVTQREEGGWWEGTLNDKTGWFPSNYVMEYKAPLPITDSIRPPEEIQEYRSVVLKDLLDSERAHVAEVQGLLENFLEPLQQTQILNADEYAQLMCNFVEVVKTHEELLTQMEECNDRVGKLFLNKAPLMKQVHQAYCAAHPKAIVILDKYKDELEKYMEQQGAAKPGLLVLTTGLSKPFRRLDKYSAMLQELERHMESSHPDRGDTQRSVAVYKDIAATCSATRRQKELELQVLTGPVRGWQGQELSSLGEIIHMGSVAVGLDHRDRYFVLFPQTLLILSVSQRMSAFIYEGKLPLTGIVVNRLEDSDTFKNAFEINSPLIERIIAVCQGPNEANKWVELLTSTNASLPIGIKRQHSNLSIGGGGGGGGGGGHISTPPSHVTSSSSSIHNLDARGYCTRFSLCAYYNTPQMRVTLPPSNYPPTAPYANLSDHFAKLVQAGQLKAVIIKMLLYPQSRQSINMDAIPLRKRRHKTCKKLARSLTPGEERSAEEKSGGTLERQDAFSLPTDSESGGSGIVSAHDFDFVRFSRNDSIVSSTGTFIDHGPGAATPPTGKPTRHCSSINLINFDSGSDDGRDGLGTTKKDSLIIGSKTMRAIGRKSSEQSIIIHTSKAHLTMGGGGAGGVGGLTQTKEISIPHAQSEQLLKPEALLQQQTSETSEKSSVYGGRLKGAYIACENLADLCDETKIKNSSVQHLATSPPERHSMPNIFVGNRFNRSSKTEVYVPSWQDRNDMQNQSADAVEINHGRGEGAGGDDTVDGEVHASTLDIPAMSREAPDKLQAELLYNFNDLQHEQQQHSPTKLHFQLNNGGDDDHVIAPPSMFNNNKNFHLSQTELCFEPKRSSNEEMGRTKRNSVKRCISYHYVPLMQEEHQQGGEANSSVANQVPPDRSDNNNNNRRPFPLPGQSNSSTTTSPKCKCCESSQCPSPRSSDSGMAGSCTINSPDPPATEGGAYEPFYDVDGNLKLLSSNNDLTRFDVCGTFREKFLENSQQSQQEEEAHGEHSQPPNQITSLEFQRNSKSIFISSTAPSHSQQPSSYATPNGGFIFTSQSPHESGMEPPQSSSASTTNPNETPGVFRSGMYAHWWKKETLPNEIVKSIAQVYNKRLPPPSHEVSLDSHCSLCSSCQCSLGGASGFSEGAAYCSLCQDCISICSSTQTSSSSKSTCSSSSSANRQQIATNTTTTITTSAECPLCNNYNSNNNNNNSATNCCPPLRNSIGNNTRVAASHSGQLSSSAGSSMDCPICSGNYLARMESLGSIRDDEDAMQMMTSTTTTNSGTGQAMSPPANLGLLSQRINQQQQQQQQQQAINNIGQSTTAAQATNNSATINRLENNHQQQQQAAATSQHKRSLSFNHHLSYNQYTHTQHPPPHQMHHHPQQQQQPPSLPSHPVAVPNHKSNLVQTSNSISKTQMPVHHTGNTMAGAAVAAGVNARTGNTKANWNITNMRPAPPLRPSILNTSTTGGNSSGGGSGAGGSIGSNLSNYCNGRKNQPTFEEDALVLRVFEAYCAAYQNTTRNTIHSALQPWTPCLPIRGGKLKTSKHFSTSNPHLPFLCNTGVQFPGGSAGGSAAGNVPHRQNSSTSSLNSSFIWREASPNNFNLYSSSISSLNVASAVGVGPQNSATGGYRYSLTNSGSGSAMPGMSGGSGTGGGSGPSSMGLDYRALSEERATRKSLNRLKSGFGSGYDNIFMTPLLPRKNKGSPKIVKSNYQSPQRLPPPPVRNRSEDRQSSTSINKSMPNHPGLYDRRLNRSFETAGTSHRYAGYGGGYMMGYGLKSTSLRRSTPQLPNDGDVERAGSSGAAAGSGIYPTDPCTGNGDGDSSQGQSGNWCCGNFVMKQWRKINNY
ncbi:serine-rich adhesin for platelets-like [Musca vetustissima]|nr:serine-rich adhesin for platelets-like [Musca vetustissima]